MAQPYPDISASDIVSTYQLLGRIFVSNFVLRGLTKSLAASRGPRDTASRLINMYQLFLSLSLSSLIVSNIVCFPDSWCIAFFVAY